MPTLSSTTRIRATPGRRSRRAGVLLTLAAALALGGCSTVLPESYRYGQIDVDVTDPSGAPLSGARLLLYTGVRHMAVGVTNGQGHYRFDDVPTDGYGIYLTAPPQGYRLPAGDPGHRYVTLTEEGEHGAATYVLQPVEESQ